ncbi:MAG: hypothetical protein ACRD9R_08840 [Pyrinomonadaceae bacterium]
MQLIEKSWAGVRSAVYTLRKDGSGLEFVLFPMIHVGEESYYAEVRRRLAGCDLILAEGVRSKKVNLLTRSYRIVGKIRRMDLITQQEGLRLDGLPGHIINTDIEGHVFDEQWSALPLWLRLQLTLLVPVYVVYLFFFGTRELLAATMELDDLPSRDEVLMHDERWEPFDALLVDERDRVLIRRIEELAQSNGSQRKVVGVLYGAGHMRHVTAFLLSKKGYRIAAAEWVTVFDL